MHSIWRVLETMPPTVRSWWDVPFPFWQELCLWHNPTCVCFPPFLWNFDSTKIPLTFIQRKRKTLLLGQLFICPSQACLLSPPCLTSISLCTEKLYDKCSVFTSCPLCFPRWHLKFFYLALLTQEYCPWFPCPWKKIFSSSSNYRHL